MGDGTSLHIVESIGMASSHFAGPATLGCHVYKVWLHVSACTSATSTTTIAVASCSNCCANDGASSWVFQYRRKARPSYRQKITMARVWAQLLSSVYTLQSRLTATVFDEDDDHRDSTLVHLGRQQVSVSTGQLPRMRK